MNIYRITYFSENIQITKSLLLAKKIQAKLVEKKYSLLVEAKNKEAIINKFKKTTNIEHNHLLHKFYNLEIVFMEEKKHNPFEILTDNNYVKTINSTVSDEIFKKDIEVVFNEDDTFKHLNTIIY